MHVDLS